MEAATSFSSRRPAAGALPAFSLPPPTADVPRASDGLSPSLSSINTGSSQGSQAPAGMQYSYASGHVHGGWPTPGSSSYTVSSAPQAPQQSLGQQHFGGRPTMYSQPPSMQFNHARSSQSPATGGEGLPPPPYDQVHHPFQTSISGGAGGGQGNQSGMSSAPQPPQSAILSSQNPVSTQPPTPSSAPAHVDSYSHSRPPNASSYYTASSTPQQSNFPAYAPHASPTQHSPTSHGPGSRGLGSLSGQPQGPAMAPPAPYRPSYAPSPYQQLPTMGQSVMSNIHQPGGQMSMIPGMGVPAYGHHPMMYGHGQQPTQSERPFKCDQCVQSFSRNHDLKRHKRIHLAVKPFPCTFCSKSFSRKDALKRHRLVKGCEGKNGDTNGPDGAGPDRNGESDESMDVKKEE
ncbi:Fc.00g040840.m01.CDS01 [Cosmosporella sp. VM-42]